MSTAGTITGPSPSAQALGKRDNHGELKKALKDFESLFINQMLKTMREGVGKNEMFHGGSGEDIYTSMLDEELAKSIANAGGIGLEKMLYKQMTSEYGKAAIADAPEASRPVRPSITPVVRSGVPGEPYGQGKEMDNQTRLPVDGTVSSGYGLRKDPFTGQSRFHHGIDIAAPEGAPIYPPRDGTVIYSGSRPGYGNLVEVMHDDGTITRYGHTAQNLVRYGDRVERGSPIALVGSTGRSTGPHLHFEVVKDGVSIDPAGMLYG